MSADIRSVNWGPDESKGDDSLYSYFVETPHFDGIRAGNIRYIVGRKGTGKTAICERLRIMSDSDPMIHAANLSLRNFPLPAIKSLRDSSLEEKSQFVPIWTFLLAVEICQLVLMDHGAGPTEAKEEIADFLNENFPSHALAFADTLATLKNNNSKVSIGPKWASLSAGQGGQKSMHAHVHYHQVTRVLLKKLSQIVSESRFYLLLDELDEGFKANNPTLQLILLALMRATEDVYLALRPRALAFFPVLVLRSDIYEGLEDGDINKLDEYTAKLKWSSGPSQCSLRDVVEARIVASFPDEDPPLRWSSIVDVKSTQDRGGPETVWNAIVNRTMRRPRDIIKYLKECSKLSDTGLLSHELLEIAEEAYSDWLFREVRDEIQAHFPKWKEAFRVLRRLGRSTYKTAHLVRELERDRHIRKWLSETSVNALDICATLYAFGVIGNVSPSGRKIYMYDDGQEWESRWDIVVHPGLHRNLLLGEAKFSGLL